MGKSPRGYQHFPSSCLLRERLLCRRRQPRRRIEFFKSDRLDLAHFWNRCEPCRHRLWERTVRGARELWLCSGQSAHCAAGAKFVVRTEDHPTRADRDERKELSGPVFDKPDKLDRFDKPRPHQRKRAFRRSGRDKIPPRLLPCCHSLKKIQHQNQLLRRRLIRAQVSRIGAHVVKWLWAPDLP